jgi:hypothetical protein
MAPEAERCEECGHPQAELSDVSPPQSAESLAVCRGCGVVAPRQRSECEVCEHSFAEAPLEVPRLIDGDCYWVAVRARFKCRACGHKAPLNHLDMDGSVVCVSCGVDQAFRSRGWTRPLKHAHGVGDLSGPGSEGRFPDPALPLGQSNSFRDIGESETWGFSGSQGTSAGGGSTAHESLEIEAAPGHPLCDHCRAPLRIERRTDELLTLCCDACDAKPTSYPLPPQARDRIAGAASREQSSGQKDVAALLEDAGPQTVKCGECGAPLDLSGSCSVVTCRFCQVTSRIPESVLLKMGFKNPKPLIWWLLFQGPSSRRVEAEQAARREQKQQEQQRQRSQTAQGQAKGSKKGPRRNDGARMRAVGIALAVVVALVVTGLLLAQSQ